jgi:DDE superfamily endonuclease
LGPVVARSFAPAPGWSVDGHRIKAPLDYGRGQDKTWVYGALCVRDGQALTLSAPSRNTTGYLQLLQAVERTYPCGNLTLISDNLSSHKSRPIQAWLVEHPRIQQLFIPVKAAWLKPSGTLVAAVAPGSVCRTVLCRHPGS